MSFRRFVHSAFGKVKISHGFFKNNQNPLCPQAEGLAGLASKNHKTAKEIWLIYYKKHSSKPRISYNDAVDEALCFGWIDSTVKTLDQDRYCQRYSPRRKASPCSEMNKHRAMRMIKEGRMTKAGLEALEGTLGSGAEIHQGKIHHTQPYEIPAYVEKALKKAGDAWKNFENSRPPINASGSGGLPQPALRKPEKQDWITL